MDFIPCPLVDGLHLWIWPGGKGEGWKTAREQAQRALDLGAAGVIPQASLYAAKWLQGRDEGDSAPRVEIFQQMGLQVTAGFGMDGSAATDDALVDAFCATLDMPNVCLMGDEESEVKWENVNGRKLATNVSTRVIAKHADAPSRSVFCPWWKPSVHSGAPDHEFQVLFRHLFCQDYGAHGPNKGDDTLWMMGVSRKEYAARGIPAEYVHLAAQMYQHSLQNAGHIVLSGEPVMALWDVEEMDAVFAQALHARKALGQRLGLPMTRDGLKTFQAGSGIEATGDLDAHTLDALGVK